MATDPVKLSLAMKRFADASSVFLLAQQSLREAGLELAAAHAELRALGVSVTMPGAPISPAAAPAPATPQDPDAELRAAIDTDNQAKAYEPKPPKTTRD
jgi:hypothetical protein